MSCYRCKEIKWGEARKGKKIIDNIVGREGKGGKERERKWFHFGCLEKSGKV